MDARSQWRSLPLHPTGARHGMDTARLGVSRRFATHRRPMNELYDHADHVIQALWTEQQSRWRPTGPKPFITLSREAGSGGGALAKAVARKLNGLAGAGTTWRVVEEQVTTLALREHGLSTDIARYLPEDKTPEFLAMLGELVGLHPNIWTLIQKVHETQRRLATQGHVILVGRAAHLSTATVAGGLHVRTIAPTPLRIRQLAQTHGLSEEMAARHIERCDRARRLYAAQHYSVSLENPHQYDLVLNMEKLSLEQAADVMVRNLPISAATEPRLPAAKGSARGN